MDKIRQLKKEVGKFEIGLDQELDLAVTELFEGLPKKTRHFGLQTTSYP